MTSDSRLLSEIVAKNNRTGVLQVVFLDVEKYSRRRTLTQIEVIDSFTGSVTKALTDTAKEFVEYANTNNLNFQTDVIRLPTGDGAAIVFPFSGLPGTHLFFAKSVLRHVYETNQKSPCDKFTADGWCNCHANLNVRIGISEGKGIIYHDVNGGYNVAGGVINMAARVMGLVDRNQIAFTEEAYRQIIDLIDDPHLSDCFKSFTDVRIKHNITVTFHQYIGRGEPFINSASPQDTALATRFNTLMERVAKSGFPFNLKGDSPMTGDQAQDFLTGLEQLLPVM